MADERLTGVLCDLPDCMYFVRLPSQPSRAYCKHPEVHTNPPGNRCPFYRMNWEKKAAELQQRFKRR